MSDYPADIGSRPVDLTSTDTVDMFHAPVECDGMATIITNDAFWYAGGARGIQDVQGVGS